MEKNFDSVNELEQKNADIKTVISRLAEEWRGKSGEICVSRLRRISADISEISEEMRNRIRERQL